MAFGSLEPTYTVSQLGGEIRDLLAEAMPSVWVAGELQRLKSHANGHLYFELIEKGDADQIVGRLDGVLWRGDLAKVRALLGRTGQQLAEGLAIRCRVELSFYPPGGRLQLVVREVDPVFTLGQLARRRRETLAALEAAGLVELNRGRRLAELPLTLALVTSEGSAAYHDLLATLRESGFGFQVTFVHAAVQGKEAERDVAAALALAGTLPVDCVVLVRGGGARTDLAAFDSRAVAEAVARCPVPVVTGLGHEIDQSIADLVAHTAAKTPTKAGELLVERLRGAEAAFVRLRDGLIREAGEPIARARRQVERAGRGFALASPRLGRIADRLAALERAAGRAGAARLREAGGRVAHAGARLGRESARRIERSRGASETLGRRIADRAAARLALAAARLAGHGRLLTELGPERVLARGFSLTRRADGTVLRDAATARPGERLITTLAHGKITSLVEDA